MKTVLAILVILLGVVAIFWFFDTGDRNQSIYGENDIEQAIDRGIKFLSQNQKENGEFLMRVCDSTEPENCNSISSPGFTGGTLLLLEGIRYAGAANIRKKGIPFIIQEIHPGLHGTWKLFARADSRYERVPPDIDDTVLVSSFLTREAVEFPNDEKELFKYTNDAGLFYNWISDDWNRWESQRHGFAGNTKEQFPKESYFGVDCVVNADALTYLSLKNNQPQEVCSYLNDVVLRKIYPQCTFYYRSRFILFYAITNAYKHAQATCLEPSINSIQRELIETQNENGIWSNNPFNNIVAAIALLDTGYRGDKLDRAIKYIISKQEKDGGWPNAPAFPDLTNPVFYGSRELTTAAALRAIYLYQELN